MRKRYLVHCVAVASIVFISGLLGGCAKKAVTTDESMTSVPQERPTSPPPTTTPQYTPGSEESLDSQGSGRKTAQNFLEGRTTGPMLPIYFDFDQSVIRKDMTTRVIGNADYLKSNPQLTVRVEGNCDERGTNEYNMALGERRAMSAKNYLINLGVPASRITTISFGEERPLNYGHDELAWSQNRRDDFAIVE